MLCQRAAGIAASLRQAGFSVSQGADYPIDRQALLEREGGMSAFQVVRVSMDSAPYKPVSGP